MRPTQLPDSLQALADWITAAGVAAFVDLSEAQLPGAFVTIGDIDATMLASGWLDCTAKVHLLARDTGHTYALAQLTGMLQQLQDAGLIPTDVQATSLELPSHGTIPALSLTVQLD
ncbi:hypothetical protein QP918_03420 [Corynebacterium accolens]|uniref:hypothetical protein n=1 Tax=Corynebacterium accolens TaxID=38284 RepID=UPI00254B7451|nr:hypothetical protein [Corynebacterium accolens]MDK8674504.1 hypothetical protein [Corynebacterium accolens]